MSSHISNLIFILFMAGCLATLGDSYPPERYSPTYLQHGIYDVELEPHFIMGQPYVVANHFHTFKGWTLFDMKTDKLRCEMYGVLYENNWYFIAVQNRRLVLVKQAPPTSTIVSSSDDRLFAFYLDVLSGTYLLMHVKTGLFVNINCENEISLVNLEELASPFN